MQNVHGDMHYIATALAASQEASEAGLLEDTNLCAIRMPGGSPSCQKICNSLSKFQGNMRVWGERVWV
eukprot:CCRYP_007571-RF/>CCRYP_007571-RF protein AED:0.36 eAED:0.23 QI:0/-1/0/1/-1/0/1/0/67